MRILGVSSGKWAGGHAFLRPRGRCLRETEAGRGARGGVRFCFQAARHREAVGAQKESHGFKCEVESGRPVPDFMHRNGCVHQNVPQTFLEKRLQPGNLKHCTGLGVSPDGFQAPSRWFSFGWVASGLFGFGWFMHDLAFWLLGWWVAWLLGWFFFPHPVLCVLCGRSCREVPAGVRALRRAVHQFGLVGGEDYDSKASWLGLSVFVSFFFTGGGGGGSLGRPKDTRHVKQK